MTTETFSPTATGDDAPRAAGTQDKATRGGYGNPGRSERLGQVLRFGRDRARGASEVAAAKRLEVPRTTLRSATQQHVARSETEEDRYWESSVGHAQLHQLLVALHVVLTLCNPCGVEQVGQVLQLSGLSRWVGPSYGPQRRWNQQLLTAVNAFGQQQRETLGATMPRRRVSIGFDEVFFEGKPVLVALEAASGFALVETQVERCDEASWTTASHATLDGLNVQVVQGVGDEGKALGACIRNGLGAHRSTDLFHALHDMSKATARPLGSKQHQAELSAQHLGVLAANAAQARPAAPAAGVVDRAEILRRQKDEADRKVKVATTRREAMRQAIRDVSMAYHPFDLETGTVREAATVQQQLEAAHARADQVADEAGLGDKAFSGLAKAARLTASLIATVAFYHRTTRAWVTEQVACLALQTLLLTVVVPFFYLQKVAMRLSCRETRAKVHATVACLQQTLADPAGLWAQLPPLERQRLQTLALECAELFVRTSSAVEGRNGQLSLHHHAFKTLRPDKLAALTVIHNFLIRRPDGTTAAERFLGQKPPDLVEHLVAALPMMGRPAARRRRPHRKELKMVA